MLLCPACQLIFQEHKYNNLLIHHTYVETHYVERYKHYRWISAFRGSARRGCSLCMMLCTSTPKKATNPIRICKWTIVLCYHYLRQNSMAVSQNLGWVGGTVVEHRRTSFLRNYSFARKQVRTVKACYTRVNILDQPQIYYNA